MLSHDAQRDPPVGLLTLTTRDPRYAVGDLLSKKYEAFKRVIRGTFPGFQAFGRIEFSRSQRLPHIHLLIKGVATSAMAELGRLARKTWRRLTGAWRVEAKPIGSQEAVLRYLTLSVGKKGQRPPEWWTGKQTLWTRGYFDRPVAAVRAEARARLRSSRRRWLGRRRGVRAVGGTTPWAGPGRGSSKQSRTRQVCHQAVTRMRQIVRASRAGPAWSYRGRKIGRA
jgi:hypothetical protein